MEESSYKVDNDQLQRLVSEYNNLNDTLSELETDIFQAETKYLQEDCPTWNVVKGFDGFNERSQSISRRSNLTREDRIFSLSSHDSPAMNLQMDEDLRSMNSGESSPTHKSKRNRKKKTLFGEDDYE